MTSYKLTAIWENELQAELLTVLSLNSNTVFPLLHGS